MKSFLFSVLLIFSISANAVGINSQELEKIFSTFLKENNIEIDKFIQDENYFNLVIIYLKPQGFLLVSNESNAVPILAYSFSNDFPLPLTPENEINDLLNNYQGQIEAIKSTKNSKNQLLWEAIISKTSDFFKNNKDALPLTTSNWSLGNPWNADCPEDASGSGGHARVGCLAVGMGQIMYYWKHPTQGTGYHEYTSPYGLLSVDFGSEVYDYTNMFDATASSDATRLLYHCGVSVDMHYGSGVSYAWSFAAIPAMTSYFGYKDNSEMLHQANFTDFEWNTILKNELDQSRPIYFQGFSEAATTGHGFLCDGYQGEDFYHFNWGLGGSYNGYYYLDDMTPGNANFSFHQGIIRKIEPVFEFTHDLSIERILSPRSGKYLSQEENICFRISNDGTQTESNFYVQLILNETDTIKEFFSQSILPSENIDFTFNHTIDLSILGNYTLTYEILLENDEYTPNNKWTNPVICSELDLCIPEYSIGCSSGDAIDGFQILDLQNDYSGCSEELNTGYTQYFEHQPPIITIDSSYFISVKSQADDNYFSLWMDNDDSETFEDYELLIDNYLIDQSNTWINIPIELTADNNPGKHVIRLRSRKDTLIDSPCAIFESGEAEDYFVQLRDYCKKPYRFYDDFETYTNGQNLACQNEKDWTTWSGTHCSTEDALISNAYANSGTQALLIQNGDDFVHPINNFTEGIYKVEFQLYIPSGKLAYFNNLLDFNGSSSAWGQEIRFSNGTAVMDAAGDNAAQFSYSFDEWFSNKLIVNMDIDSAYYYYNETLIHSWKWSYGAHDTDALNQLGGTNFWAWTGDSGGESCYYYVDDYTVEHMFNQPESISEITLAYSEDYEDIILNWDYPDSLNFIIYHSPDNTTYLPIDTVNAFNYTDISPLSGSHYYYIKTMCNSLLSDKSPTITGNISHRLSVEAFLEGAYDVSIDSMRTSLNKQGFLPNIQVFEDSPWLYSGDEELYLFPKDMVDWVLIKLYDTTAADLISVPFDTIAAIILKDGRITDLDGNSPLSFSDTVNNQLIIELSTRNHLSIVSNYAVNQNGLLLQYDFSTAADQAWQSKQNFIGNGKFGMKAGDINSDETISNEDYLFWKTEAGRKGYHYSDINLDGEINNQDKIEFLLPNLN